MIEKYISINRAIRALQATSREIIDAYHFEGDGFAVGALLSVLSRSLSDLERIWPKDVDKTAIESIGHLLSVGEVSAYHEIISTQIPRLEDSIDDYFSSQPYGDLNYGILDLLHPRVTAASYAHFRGGRYRDAVLNSVMAIYDLIRERTGLDSDGVDLVGTVFSLQRPMLIFSTLDTDSGRNEQKGFIQILQGAYLGIRNPKAHSLVSDTDQISAAQRLVFSSMLCQKIDECNKT